MAENEHGPGCAPTKKRAISGGIAARLAGVAAVLRFALRGYDVVALILVLIAALVLLWAFVGGAAFKLAASLACALALAVAATEVPIVANSHTDAGDDADYLVVLGARVDEDGQPSYSLRYRLEAALAYLEAHPATAAVLSGGQGDDEPTTEAACMYGWLVEHGVEASRLLLEGKSSNTQENLRNSLALIGVGEAQADGADTVGTVGGQVEGTSGVDGTPASSADTPAPSARTAAPAPSTPRIAVVSSSYHLFRAKLIARGLGVEVLGVASYPGNPVVALNYFVREAPAVWKQLLMGS